MSDRVALKSLFAQLSREKSSDATASNAIGTLNEIKVGLVIVIDDL